MTYSVPAASISFIRRFRTNGLSVVILVVLIVSLFPIQKLTVVDNPTLWPACLIISAIKFETVVFPLVPVTPITIILRVGNWLIHEAATPRHKWYVLWRNESGEKRGPSILRPSFLIIRGY